MDKETIKIVNRDNCPIDFYFDSQDELRKLIKFWLWEYSNHGYVRFSIIDRGNYKAIGTIEIFARKKVKDDFGKIGVLRLDIQSTYEQEEYLFDIFKMILSNFNILFNTEYIITKANEKAFVRRRVLNEFGFGLIEDPKIIQYDDYFIKQF